MSGGIVGGLCRPQGARASSLTEAHHPASLSHPAAPARFVSDATFGEQPGPGVCEVRAVAF